MTVLLVMKQVTCQSNLVCVPLKYHLTVTTASTTTAIHACGCIEKNFGVTLCPEEYWSLECILSSTYTHCCFSVVENTSFWTLFSTYTMLYCTWFHYIKVAVASLIMPSIAKITCFWLAFLCTVSDTTSNYFCFHFLLFCALVSSAASQFCLVIQMRNCWTGVDDGMWKCIDGA